MEINEKQIKDAFAAATSEETKKVLTALFGKQHHDYHDIKTYEDACAFLGEEPLDGDVALGLAPDVQAYIKLTTIAKALRGGDETDLTDPDRELWYPWFCLWTQDEIDDLSDNEKERITSICCLLAGHATDGAVAGFGCLDALNRPASAHANVGARLCQYKEEIADHFGMQFKQLWFDYLVKGCKL